MAGPTTEGGMTDQPESQASYTVHLEPSGLSFTANHGQLMMAAANQAGLFWPTVCGGEARCIVCAFTLTADAAKSLEPATDMETQALARGGRTPDTHRLACQAKVIGDVTVQVKRVATAKPGDRMPFA